MATYFKGNQPRHDFFASPLQRNLELYEHRNDSNLLPFALIAIALFMLLGFYMNYMSNIESQRQYIVEQGGRTQ